VLDPRGVSRLKKMLAEGKSQTECAKLFGVSLRTIGRTVARIKAGDNPC
jgi:transposase